MILNNETLNWMDSPSIQFCSGFDQTSPVGDMLIHHFIIFLSKYLHNVTKHLKDFTENRYNRPSISAATSIAWSTINNQRWKTGFARSWTRPNVYKIWQLKEKWLNCYSLEGITGKVKQYSDRCLCNSLHLNFYNPLEILFQKT